MTDRNKSQSTAPTSNQKALQSDLLYLSTYIKRCPISIQKQLLPYCFELRKEYPSDQRIKDLSDSLLGETQTRPQASPNSQNLIRNLFRILQLKVLPSTFNKIIDKIEYQRVRPQSKSRQQIISKSSAFERIDTIYPDYDIYFKMSKQEREHYLPHYNPKNQFKEYFTEPRLTVRLDQLAHFRSNQKLKGDILFLHYEGNIITGGKSYAVGKEKSIEVWEMASETHPTLRITPITSQNGQENDDKKNQQEKKQKELKVQIPPGTKFSLNNVYNGHTQKVTSLSFSLDQLYLVSGSVDRSVKLWCLRLKMCLCTFRGHLKTVWDVHFSPSGYYFLSGGADGLMILWKSDVPIAQKCFDHRSDVYKVSFARDPSFAISAGQDGNIKMWKILEAQLIRVIKLNRPVINLNLGLSGTLLVGVENDGRITIFNLSKGQVVNSFYFYEDKKSKQSQRSVSSSKMRIHDVCLSEDEREITCVTSKYIVIYSMDRLEMKVTNNIFTFFETEKESSEVIKLPPKEIIYMGIETNLTFCKYQHKNLLVVGGSGRT